MLGNWATGRVKMLSDPTSTRTIEMTIATMGRLMKNLDMDSVPLCRGKRLRVHVHAWANLLNAFSNHGFTGLESVRHNPLRADLLANLDGANLHFAFPVNDGYLITALQLGHSALRNEHGVVLGSNDSANFAVTTGPQNVPGIRKQPSDANRAGTFIDLAVGEIEGACVGVGSAVRQDQFEAEILVGFEAALLGGKTPTPVKILRLTHREIDFDGIHCGDRSDGSAAGVGQSADLKLGLTGDAVNWCS